MNEKTITNDLKNGLAVENRFSFLILTKVRTGFSIFTSNTFDLWIQNSKALKHIAQRPSGICVHVFYNNIPFYKNTVCYFSVYLCQYFYFYYYIIDDARKCKKKNFDFKFCQRIHINLLFIYSENGQFKEKKTQQMRREKCVQLFPGRWGNNNNKNNHQEVIMITLIATFTTVFEIKEFMYLKLEPFSKQTTSEYRYIERFGYGLKKIFSSISTKHIIAILVYM